MNSVGVGTEVEVEVEVEALGLVYKSVTAHLFHVCSLQIQGDN